MKEPTKSKRLFVGNLFPDVSHKDLQQRFERFGSIGSIEIKNKRDIDGRVISTFAFLDVDMSDSDLAQCISTYTNTRWKGYNMKLQQAKESFMERLAREREEKQQQFKRSSQEELDYDPLRLVREKEGKSEAAGGPNTTSRAYLSQLERRNPAGFHRGSSELKSVAEKEDTSYSPMAMLKGNTVSDKEELAVTENEHFNTSNVGTLQDGVITFDSKDHFNKHQDERSAKVYHSSSEDEENSSRQVKKKKSKSPAVKKVVDMETSDKQTVSTNSKPSSLNGTAVKRKNSSPAQPSDDSLKKQKRPARPTYYSSSSDEEDEGGAGGSSRQEETGGDVLKRFQSFSKIWQDSDDEESEDENEDKEEETDNNSMLSGRTDGEKDRDDCPPADGEVVDRPAELRERNMFKDISRMRFDPEDESHQKFVVDNSAKRRAESSHEVSQAAKVNGDTGSKEDKFYKVSSGLKDSFKKGGGSTSAGGFSFGFQTDGDEKDKTVFKLAGVEKAAAAAVAEEEDDEEVFRTGKASDEVRFGLQLRSKSMSTASEPFFFRQGDKRLGEGLEFFFEQKVDPDEMRTSYEAKRPELAAILKKRHRQKSRKDSKLNFGSDKKKKVRKFAKINKRKKWKK